MENLTPLENKIYQRIHDGQSLLEVQSFMDLSRQKVKFAVNSLIAKGYAMRDNKNNVKPLVKLEQPKKEPIRIQSTWSNQPALRMQHDEKANSEVSEYNYRSLSPDHPVRVHIESLFKGGKGA